MSVEDTTEENRERAEAMATETVQAQCLNCSQWEELVESRQQAARDRAVFGYLSTVSGIALFLYFAYVFVYSGPKSGEVEQLEKGFAFFASLCLLFLASSLYFEEMESQSSLNVASERERLEMELARSRAFCETDEDDEETPDGSETEVDENQEDSEDCELKLQESVISTCPHSSRESDSDNAKSKSRESDKDGETILPGDANPNQASDSADMKSKCGASDIEGETILPGDANPNQASGSADMKSKCGASDVEDEIIPPGDACPHRESDSSDVKSESREFSKGDVESVLPIDAQCLSSEKLGSLVPSSASSTSCVLCRNSCIDMEWESSVKEDIDIKTLKPSPENVEESVEEIRARELNIKTSS